MGAKPLVIYHGNCQDGFTAAWAIWKVHPDWEFYPAKHGDPPPDVTGRVVYMVDFSYKQPVIEEMLTKAEKIVILDHHKTAMNDLNSLAIIYPPDELEVWFDMEKSGARLAWEYFHPEKDIPQLVLYVEDRDLWRFKRGDTKAITAYLFAQDYDFSGWTVFADYIEETLSQHDECVTAGQAILDAKAKDTLELLANKFRYVIGGHEVWTVNLPYTFSSDAGNILAKGEPFGSTYYYDGEGYVFSLRSDENGLDVSEIAKQYGGGGHKHAAGFKLKSFFVLIDPAKVDNNIEITTGV